MDDSTYTLISLIIDQANVVYRYGRGMHSYYLFHDKRAGTVTERFEADAAEWVAFERMKRP